MGSLSNLQFYIVVHDRAVRESIKFLLESYGANVHSFANGRSFLINIHSLESGYVLIEDEVNDINVSDLLEKIKYKTKNNHVLLLVNTNYANYKQQTVKTSGISTILHKPINSIKLLQTINALQ